MLKCEQCGREFPDSAKFCPDCGTALSAGKVRKLFCPKCGAEQRNGAKFCHQCGSAIPVLTVGADVKEPEQGTVHSPAQSVYFSSEEPVQHSGTDAAVPADFPGFAASDSVPEQTDETALPAGAATEAAPEPEAPKTQPDGKKAAPKKRTLKSFGMFAAQLVLFCMIAAVLVLSGLKIYRYTTDRFRPAKAAAVSEDNTRQVFSDGSISVALQYDDEDLLFRSRSRADMNIIITSQLTESISGLTLQYEMPAGIIQTGSDAAVRLDKLMPGSVRRIPLHIQQESFLDRYYKKILIVLVTAAVAEVILLVLYILTARSKKKELRRIAALTMAMMLALPTLSTVVSSYDQTEGKSHLVYDSDRNITGIAREISTTDSYRIGQGDTGDIVFTANYSVEEALRLTAQYDSAEKTMHLSWNPVTGAERYTAECSTDGETFSELYTGEDDRCSVSNPPVGTALQYRVYAVFAEGRLASNTALYIIDTDGLRCFSDNDGDLLTDSYEESLGTNRTSEDSDGDGLSDYAEITDTFTDPTVYDGEQIGVADGDVDSDSDGLTNAEELARGTDPLVQDSDRDGLTDGFEVDAFGSDPLLYDTDSDGLSDGTECMLGSNPNAADSDSDGTPDAQTVFHVTIPAENDEDAAITVDDTGNALSVAESHDVTGTLSAVDYIVSPVVSVSVAETTDGSITLPITAEAAQSGEDVVVAVYNQEQNDFHILEGSTVDSAEHTVTAPLSGEYYAETESVSDNGQALKLRRSVYCAFYVKDWHMQFEAALTPDREDAYFFDVEFVIDESGSMEDGSKGGAVNDPNRYRVEAAKRFTYGLLEGDRAAVVGFNDGARRKISLTEDMESVRSAIDAIVGNAGGTALYNGLKEAVNELVNSGSESRGKFIIALTDGEDNNSAEDVYEQIIATCKQNEIPIYTIGLGSSPNTNLLSKLATYTGGAFFHILSAEDLPTVFNRIQTNAFYGDDLDGDGLADAVEEYGLRDGMGNIYMTSKDSRFTDDDDMPDGEEAGNVLYTSVGMNGETISYYIMLTDPTKGDTDGDGVDDLDERLMGTLPWCVDTDCDGLSDGDECAIGYNPLTANYDGDAFNDYDEYTSAMDYASVRSIISSYHFTSGGQVLLNAIFLLCGCQDPFTYDLDTAEKMQAFSDGAVLGDWGEHLANCGLIQQEIVESAFYSLGGIVMDFIPVVSIFTAIRDALEDAIMEHDPLGFVLNLSAIIPEAGSALKTVHKVCEILNKVWSKTKDAAGHAGTYTPVKLAASPAFTYCLLHAIRVIDEKFENIDMHTQNLDKMIQDQLNRGLSGLTKTNARSWESFIGYEDFSGLTSYYADDAVTDPEGNAPETIQLSVANTAAPVELMREVRRVIGTQPGGSVIKDGERSAYRLVRAFDLENTEYQLTDTLKLALQDSVNRAADYFESDYPEMEKRLCVVLTKSLVSKDTYYMLRDFHSYAEQKGVQLEYVFCKTTDDPSYNPNRYQEIEGTPEHESALIILPGITGSELVAGEDFTGSKINMIQKGDNVWLPLNVDLQKLSASLTEAQLTGIGTEAFGLLDSVTDALNMLPMNERGESRYKLYGKEVHPEDSSVGALGTGTAMYKGMLNAFSDQYDVIFYSYDWRGSTVETAKELEAFISGHHYKDVRFVCHSMGGIVASDFLARSQANRDLVKQVITVGTPYGGSPKALYTFFTGKFMDNTDVLDDVFKSLSHNLPSVYELLPYQNPINAGFQYVNTISDTGETAPCDADGIRTLIDDHFNSGLQKVALGTEKLIYSSGRHIMNDPSIDLTVIAGTNTPTISKIYVQDGEAANIGRSDAGDGTVPLWSAILSDGKYFNKPIYLVDQVSHSALFSDPDVIQTVTNLLQKSDSPAAGKVRRLDKDNTELAELAIDPDLYANAVSPEEIPKSGIGNDLIRKYYNTFVAHCPVSLELHDASGETVGIVSNQGIYAKPEYSECFGLTQDGETKQVTIPDGCTVKVIGTGTGTMDAMTATTDCFGNLVESAVFRDIPVEKDMTAAVSIRSGSDSELDLQYPDASRNQKLTAKNDASVLRADGTDNRSDNRRRQWILAGAAAALLAVTLLTVLIVTLTATRKSAERAERRAMRRAARKAAKSAT